MKAKETCKILESSGFEFHLCGSRYLHTAEPDSDWDYVITSTPEVRRFLLDQGFKVMPHSGRYEGSYAVSVLEKHDEDGVVQVSCEVDSKFKRAIMTALNQSFALRKLDKSLRKQPERDGLWQALYQLAGFVAVERKDGLDSGDF